LPPWHGRSAAPGSPFLRHESTRFRPPVRARSLLRALGLPEIDLVATDAVAGVAPETVAGRYLVVLENRTSGQTVEIDFAAPPTAGDILMDLYGSSYLTAAVLCAEVEAVDGT
jgi:hypothetical protein